MAVIYENNRLRTGAQKPRFILPGDISRAEEYKFLPLPKVTKFSYIDNAIEDVVWTLGRKGWNIPDIDVTFSVSGKEEAPVHTVAKIKGGKPGKKWEIDLSRAEYDFNDCNIFTRFKNLRMPGGHLTTNGSNGALHFNYVGDDWARDEDYFYYNPKVNSKKDDAPRIYLMYEHIGAYFRHTNDNECEYDLEEGDPTHIHENDVYVQYAAALEEILGEVEKYPDISGDPYVTWEKLAAIEPIPAPKELKPFYIAKYIFGGVNDRGLILSRPLGALFGVQNKTTPEARRNFPTNDKIDGQYYCGFSLPPYSAISGLWGVDATDKDASIVKVNLKYANDVYVVDEAAVLPAYKYLTDAACDEKRGLNENENAELRQILGNTLVPLTEYRNNYKNPIMLIGRPLWEDEAEHITGYLREKMDADGDIYEAMRKSLEMKNG